MEILGGEFEDSVFISSRDRNATESEPYTAKQCEPQKALQEYSSCFSLLASTNLAMRRDVQESQARCLCHLGRHWEALDIAHKLRHGSTNTDHLTTVLNLQISIYHSMGNIQSVSSCLQQLIALQPFNPWYWKMLAEAYMDILQAAPTSFTSRSNSEDEVGQTESSQSEDSMSFGICGGGRTDSQSHKEQLSKEFSGSSTSFPTSGCRSDQKPTEAAFRSSLENVTPHLPLEACTQENVKDLRMKACASLIRTRLLLQLLQPQLASFILEKNLKEQSAIDEKLKGFRLNEASLILIAEIMGEDLAQEKLKEESQVEGKVGVTAALASFVATSEPEFEGRWFQKVKNNLGHFAPCLE
ncbi:uncharacterized protein C8orf76 homolog isoform X2 [Pleurodeles waltl]|uniref:uncharacterized protein C8orf76 homolog isoform X2 n=1 Tax=Pleurodeles waltl TaxID=8319 RepID=UPI0037095364